VHEKERREEMSRAQRLLDRLHRMGFASPYEAWLCVEHFECPEGVDYGEAFNTLMDYLELLAEQGLNPEEEWERRYMEELEAEKKRQRLPVPA